MNPVNKASKVASKVRISSPLLSGLLYSFVCLGLAALILSAILTFSGMKESSLPDYVYFIHCLSLFIGGFVSGKRAGLKGWYHGGITGLSYGLIIILSSFLGFDSGFHMQTAIFLLVCLVVGALGGMIGVNAGK